MKREKSVNEKLKNKKMIYAVSSFIAICFIVVLFIFVILPGIKYHKALNLIETGKYDEAYSILSEINKKDVIVENKYERAETLIKEKDYDSAYSLLSEIGKDDVIISNKYERASEFFNNKDYDSAYALFKDIDYEDSAEKADTCPFNKQSNNLAKAKKGDYVKFGYYEQDNNTSNDKEEIEWLVLERVGDTAFLISKYGIDCKQFNDSIIGTTWEYSSLREWLNDSFYNTAFTNKHKEMIKESTLSPRRNPEDNYNLYGEPGNYTKDKVFVISAYDALDYFKNDKARVCTATEYAKNQGAWVDDNNVCCWWLRTPGYHQSDITSVAQKGIINYNGWYLLPGNSGKENPVGYSATYDMIAVRPSIKVIIN